MNHSDHQDAPAANGLAESASPETPTRRDKSKVSKAGTPDATPSERELIEAAAAAAPSRDSTTTQRAMDVMAAAAIQRDAVAHAYEQQRSYITKAVHEQRDRAMTQVDTAHQNHAAQAAAPVQTNTAPGALPNAGISSPIADEIAQVIRSIISKEIEAQLQALLAAQAAPAAAEQQPPRDQ